MTIEEAIARAREMHRALGCGCEGAVIAAIRNDHFPGAEPSKEHYNVTIEHQDWCVLYQSMAAKARGVEP